MEAPPPDMIAEVDDLVGRIKAFQEKRGSPIARYIRRARKGRAALAELEALGLSPTTEFAALYHNWNGTDPGDRINMWASNVFFDFDWERGQSLIDIAKAHQRLTYRPPRRTMWLANGTLKGAFALAIGLKPGDSLYGRIRLENGFGRRAYVAFDSPLSMLRTVAAAGDAGLIRYGEEDRILPWHEDVADIAADLNPGADFWPAVQAGSVDWDEIGEADRQEMISVEELWMAGNREAVLPERLLSAAFLPEDRI